jgi:hypothetical protein
MAGQLRSVVLLLAFACTQAAAQVDANFQALLSALMQGTPATMLTALPDGTVQVTSVTAPGRRSAADAALLIEQARLTLSNFGVTEPTGEQLALALVGGTISVPSGSTQIPGVLPAGGRLQSQVVNANGLPQVVGASPPGVASGQAAAGGSTNALNGALAGLTPAQQTQALQIAHDQLAAMGIANPTPQQVAAMLNGGVIANPAGTPTTLPGFASSLPPPSTAVPPAGTPTPFLR